MNPVVKRGVKLLIAKIGYVICLYFYRIVLISCADKTINPADNINSGNVAITAAYILRLI